MAFQRNGEAQLRFHQDKGNGKLFTFTSGSAHLNIQPQMEEKCLSVAGAGFRKPRGLLINEAGWWRGGREREGECCTPAPSGGSRLEERHDVMAHNSLLGLGTRTHTRVANKGQIV